MSAAHKCDRCSAFHEPKLGNVCLEVNETTEIRDNDGAETQAATEFDLCPACSELLKAWLGPLALECWETKPKDVDAVTQVAA